MAYVTVPSRRIIPPTYPVQLRPEFQQNLLSFTSPLLVGATDQRWPLSVGARMGAERGKPGWKFTNSAGDVISNTDTTKLASSTSSARTFMCSVTVRASIAGSHMLGSISESGNDRLRVFLTDTNNTATANAFGSSSVNAISGNNVWTYGETEQVGAIFNGLTSRILYVNGTATSNSANAGASASLTDLEYGSYRGANNLDGVLHYAGWWFRAWSAEEIGEFQRYPYMWVQEYRRPIYSMVNVAAAASFNAAWANSANTMIQTPTT